MIINVTQEHIDKGFRKICRACPVALAMKDATGKNFNVTPLYVRDMTGVDIHEEFKGKRYKIPKCVTSFVENFDTEYPVEPFSFEFNWEEEKGYD